MGYACDLCQSLVSREELAILSGWYGCKEVYAATARKEACCRQIPLTSPPTVEHHVCVSCVETVLAKEIRLNAQKPRMVLCAERKKGFPDEPVLKSLRKTAYWTSDILCDRCESSCFERHVELRSQWVDKEQAQKVSHLCSDCYRSYVRSLLSTETTGVVAVG